MLQLAPRTVTEGVNDGREEVSLHIQAAWIGKCPLPSQCTSIDVTLSVLTHLWACSHQVTSRDKLFSVFEKINRVVQDGIPAV